MKRSLKYTIIWVVLTAAIVLIVNNFMGAAFAEAILMPSLGGYNERMAFPLPEPTNAEEEKQNGGALVMRSLLCDSESFEENGLLANAHFGNYGFRESYVFLNPQGEHAFSYGIFAYAYRETDAEEAKLTTHPIGLIDVKALMNAAGADQLYTALEAHPDAVMRLNAYNVSDYLVEPAKITLTSESGEEYATVELATKEPPAYTGETDCLIYNTYTVGDSAGEGVIGKLRLAKSGEREIDRMAADLAQQAMNGAAEQSKTYNGFGSRTIATLYVSNGYKMVHVNEVIFWKGVLFYIVLIDAVMTLILLIVYSVRGKKKAKKASE